MSARGPRNAGLNLIIAVILAFLLGTATHALAEPCAMQSTGQPSLSELQRAARQRAGLDDLPRRSRRARAAGLLPTVMLRAARALDWDDGGVHTGVPTEVGNNVIFEARLTWRLDRLLYDQAEPRIDGVERDGVRARNALDAEVTRLYFQWRRTMVAAESGDPLKIIDAEEAWAQLDARTGGWLTRRRCPP